VLQRREHQNINKKESNFLVLKTTNTKAVQTRKTRNYAGGKNHDNLCVITENSNEDEQSEESSEKNGILLSYVKCDIFLVNTVDRIRNKYTVKEYSDVCKAWSIQDIIG